MVEVRCFIELRIPMRGYESMFGSKKIDEQTLRIPMRGYEVGVGISIDGEWFVTNPHAGL